MTWDVMDCQKAIAHPIREPEADYVLGIKKNPKGLYDRLADTLALERATHFADCPHEGVITVAKVHGRIANRRGGVLGAPAYLAYVDPHRDGRDLRSLVAVEAERRGGGRSTTAIRYFISRLPPQAAPLRAAVRPHGRMDVALGRTTAAAVRGRRPTIWRSGDASPTTCSCRINHGAWGPPTNGWPQPGTRITCVICWGSCPKQFRCNRPAHAPCRQALGVTASWASPILPLGRVAGRMGQRG